MGANYAVLVANLTCFCYETSFLSRRINALNTLKSKIRLMGRSRRFSVQRSALLAELNALHDLIFTAATSRRYTDDRIDCLRGRTRVSHNIYDDRRHGGDDGIYPRDVLTFSGAVVALLLEIETFCSAGRKVHFLDYWIWIDVALRQKERAARFRERRHLPPLRLSSTPRR